MSRYTSITHKKPGMNVQLDFDSIEQWEREMDSDRRVVWSLLVSEKDGRVIAHRDREGNTRRDVAAD